VLTVVVHLVDEQFIGFVDTAVTLAFFGGQVAFFVGQCLFEGINGGIYGLDFGGLEVLLHYIIKWHKNQMSLKVKYAEDGMLNDRPEPKDC
jgi:hypothetical protein